MLRIGLTGGIACGKSHVLRGLARYGLPTLDLDQVAHELLGRDGRAVSAVVAAFGAGILDASGAVDRRVLGERVFHDEEARRRLNGIVHPEIRLEEEARARAMSARTPLLVVDGTLLVESGTHLRFDRLVVAHCRREQQIERLVRRDGLQRAEALRRIETQMPIEEKRQFASFEIDTAGAIEETDSQVAALAADLQWLARHRPQRASVSLEQAVGCVLHGPRRGVGGLTPARALAAVAEAGTLDLAQLARVIDPVERRPWYECAAEPGVRLDGGPEQLSAAAVLWVLAGRGLDREGAVAAAASLARLTHRSPDAIAGACLAADALSEIAASGALSGGWEGRGRRWQAEARKWGAVEAPRPVQAAVEAALRQPRDLDAARRECQVLGGDPGLCGALVGLVIGAREGTADTALVDACRRLGFSA